MSNLIETKKKCAMCGHEQTFIEIISTNSIGFMDLDTRPVGMKRLNIKYEIQLCEKCHYSNVDIEQLVKGIKPEYLNAKNYLSVVRDDSLDKVAKAYLLAGHLNAVCVQFKMAGFYFLSAAWFFDDIGQRDFAVRARKKAIENLTRYVEDTADVNFATIVVDLYRRNGDFEEAIKSAKQLLDFGVEDILSKILDYETILAKKKDLQCYTIEEAL